MALLTPSNGWPYLHKGQMFHTENELFPLYLFSFMLRICYSLAMLESKETSRNYLSSFVSRTSHHFAASVPAVMCLQAERSHGEDEPLLRTGNMAEGWLHKGLAELPHSSCPKLSSAVVFKCNTVQPSPLEAEIKFRCWLWRLHQFEPPFFKRGTVPLPAQEK